VLDLGQRGRLGLVEALPRVGDHRRQRVVADPVEDGDLGVDEPLHAEVTEITTVTAHN